MSNGFNIVNLSEYQDGVYLAVDPDKLMFRFMNKFNDVLIIGMDKEDGQLMCVWSYPDAHRAVTELERAKQIIMDHLYSGGGS